MLNEVIFDVPKALRKVNIVVMGIFKSCNLVPKSVNLIKTVLFDIDKILIHVNS